MAGFCKTLTSVLFEYDTSKVVHIQSKTIGIINRLIQLSIICYVIIYVIIYEKGYQDTQKPYSSVTTKVKGVSSTNLTPELNDSFPLYNGIHVWDSADYIVPPEENGAFFVMTNMIITPDQSQGACPEDPNLTDVKCYNDSDCEAMEPTHYGHGIKTGRCVKADRGDKPHLKVCEIYAWCPVEIDELPMQHFNLSPGVPLLETENFTVLIKNSIQFPKFNKSRRNIPSDRDPSYLKKCTYDPVKDPYCPIIKLGTIVKEAGEDYKTLAYRGGVMGIIINWDCDFDPLTYSCEPKYTFRRLDDVEAPIAPGYNFRFARYYDKDGKLHRTLFKAYGIRYVVLVYGQGGQFSVVPLFLNLGSGLALLGIATVLCDIVVLYFVKRKTYYRSKKYQVVNDPDDDDERGHLLYTDEKK